jgi:hypothetical protein
MIIGCIGFVLNVISAAILHGMLWTAPLDCESPAEFSQSTIMMRKKLPASRKARVWSFPCRMVQQQVAL